MGEKTRTEIRPIYISLGMFAILMAIFAFGNRSFLSPYNIFTIVNSAAILLAVGLGQVCVILTGGIDLSVGSLMSLVSVVFMLTLESLGIWAFPLVIAMGTVCGFLNGILVSKLRIPSFIATLGTQGILISLTYFISAAPLSAPSNAYNLLDIVNGKSGPIPNVWLIALVIFLMYWIIQRFTKLGRHIIYIGANERMSWLSGLNIDRVRILAFALSGFGASVAGVILSATLFSGYPTIGAVYVLNSIAVVVVGGTAMTGGAGGGEHPDRSPHHGRHQQRHDGDRHRCLRPAGGARHHDHRRCGCDFRPQESCGHQVTVRFYEAEGGRFRTDALSRNGRALSPSDQVDSRPKEGIGEVRDPGPTASAARSFTSSALGLHHLPGGSGQWMPLSNRSRRNRMDMNLKGKAALITGGTVGIGLAVAKALAKEGVAVAIIGRDGARARAEAEGIAKAFGVRALGLEADVSKAGTAETCTAAAVEAFGGLDILINNAGTGSSETIMEAGDEKWQYYWDLHVMAAVRFSRAATPFMRKRGGGVILSTASICAKQPLGYEPIYNTTKAALVMFGKCLSNELIGDGIRVNTINPGLILTPDWKKTAGILTKGTGTTVDQYLDKIAKDNAPIGRFGTPEELADFYVFMCSPRSSYCVGSTYYVDGGWLKTVE